MTSVTSLYEIKEPIRTPNSVSHRSSTTIDRKAVGGPVDIGSSASRNRKITLSSGAPPVGASSMLLKCFRKFTKYSSYSDSMPDIFCIQCDISGSRCPCG
ncbi:Hypothetical predicted protein [Octopus vulgaris]|uniref:Uncharacterized protein n=1 Tax=Octopus vulgaris TaxID=6645 RepID=A0AA36FM06_OCTVU|nr:Hypothetical predicted protein [Octopus vulgaris]